MSEQKKLLTLPELAAYLGLHPRTFFDQVREGRFPVKPLEGTSPQRWSVAQIDEWLKTGSI